MNCIKLAIERFWVEPGNFEMWCDVLSRVPSETQARSIKEIAKLYLDKDVEVADQKLDRSKELFGLMGYHYAKSAGNLEIKGVNFLERRNKYLQLTGEAADLVKAYQRGDGWERMLARQLLAYSPRTRVVMYLLLNGGVIKTQGLPINELGKWQIEFQGVTYWPFASNPTRNDMNQLLNEFRDQALGPLWQKVIEDNDLVLADDWRFVGSAGPEPAINNLTAFMRCPMQLFDYLDWFLEMKDGMRKLDLEKITDDIEIHQLFTVENREKQSELDWLKQEIERQADYRGLFPVESVLEGLLESYYPNWDKGLSRFVDHYLTKGLNEGWFVLVDNESGQPRHGRGYLGKREYQLIRLALIDRGDQDA